MTSEPAIFPHLPDTIPFPREQIRMRRIEAPKPSSSIFRIYLMLNYLTFIRTGRVSIPKTADVYGVPTSPLGIVSIVTVAAGYAVIRTPVPRGLPKLPLNAPTWKSSVRSGASISLVQRGNREPKSLGSDSKFCLERPILLKLT